MLFKKANQLDAPTTLPRKNETTSSPVPARSAENGHAKSGQDRVPEGKMADEVIAYPTGPRLVLLLVSVFLSMFLVALDRLIIATAIPQITDDFKSQTDIGWYGSAYLLTTCASQLLFGKLYTYFSIKALFLATVLLFEVGSALCGAAPNSIAFILGRAIAGIGAAGISSGGILLIVFSLPLHKRPLFQGLFGAVFGIASVVGPVVGGALTTHVTWRWCFYINLPFGGVAMAVILFLLQVPDRETTKIPTKDKLAQLDVYGTVLFVPGCICLILALQWGGVTYSWNNGRMIALLVLAGLLLLGFVMVQILLPKTATIPPRIFKQRSILSGFFTTVCIGSEMMIFTYYLPIWFQAIQGVSAVQSGIRILPLVLSLVIGSLVAGALTHRIGYYTPLMIGGVCFMSIGAGLLYTLQVDTSEGQWIGYQILYGWGMGLATQAPNLAAQTVLSNRDIPIGTSLLFFAQLLGGAIFVSVGQNVLDNQLLKRLSSVPGFGASWIENNGATSLTGLPASVKPTVIAAYNESLRQVFLVGLILVCLIMPGTLGMEWLSVKKNMKTQEKKSDEDGRMEDNTKKNIPRPDEPETKTSVSVPVGADEEAGEEKEINL